MGDHPGAGADTLGPPNHKIAPVTGAVDVPEAYDVAPGCNNSAVSSSERDNGAGNSKSEPDWQITRDLTVDLRAGKGSGRMYTITVECIGASNNKSTDTVTVPHDDGKKKGKP